MCVVSMIMDHYNDKWKRLYDFPNPWRHEPYGPGPSPLSMPEPYSPPPPITLAEIEEFRKLLERAREYDRRNNELDCELPEKIRLIKELADKLGVNIDFVGEKS